MKSLMNRRWFIALVFAVLYKPTIFSQLPQLALFDTVTNVLKLAVLAVLLVWFVMFYKKVSLFFISLALLQVWRVICTVYNGGDYTSLFLTIFNALAIALVVEMGLKTDPDALLDGATFILGFFVVCNFVTILMFPDGMYEYGVYTENYLFGYRNNMVMMIIPAAIFSAVRSFKYYDRLSKSSWLIVISSVASIFLAFSATGAIGIVIFCLVLILAIIGFMSKIFNIATYIVFNIVFFFSIIIMRVQDLFAFIIVELLGKDLTFTGRTDIWDKSLSAFLGSPVFGVGEIEAQASRDLIGATHAHNYYLDLLYKSGVFGFLIFMAILIICGISLYKNRNNGKVVFVVSGALFAFMVMLQSEAYYNIYYFFSILSLAAFIEYALPKKDENGNIIIRQRHKNRRQKDLIHYGYRHKN